ncbi:MAG: amidohydrolase family protein [Planctomycetaceae bacterium]|nr:amidohydrolase family protein [Planctomycetaceae bacterium]
MRVLFSMTRYAEFICLLLVSLSTAFVSPPASATDEVPGPPQRRPIALTNGVVHPISSPATDNASVVFEAGKITAVGRGIRIPAGAEVIDLQGRHVYPSLIEARSQIGLKEVSAVRASVDTSETGSLNPNVRANVSFNPDSEVIPVTRANGVLVALTAPSGGRISGQASVMQLEGWTYEEMTVLPSAGMIVDWPSPPSSGVSPGLQQLRKLFDDARAYRAARRANDQNHPFDIRLESLLPVLDTDIPVIATANDAREIQAAVAFSAEQNIRLIIFGGHDAEECAELLRKHGVPVIIDSVHRPPMRRYEAYDAAYTLPARLQRAGVAFCISGYRRDATWNARNLPYHAATAVAHGLSHDDALRSVTMSPAQILGIDDRLGSLEPGRDATLFISDGDPLETSTNIEMAFVQGRRVSLTSRHTRLNDKYRQKYQQQAANP